MATTATKKSTTGARFETLCPRALRLTSCPSRSTAKSANGGIKKHSKWQYAPVPTSLLRCKRLTILSLPLSVRSLFLKKRLVDHKTKHPNMSHKECMQALGQEWANSPYVPRLASPLRGSSSPTALLTPVCRENPKNSSDSNDSD